jgi:hypothetical protein
MFIAAYTRRTIPDRKSHIEHLRASLALKEGNFKVIFEFADKNGFFQVFIVLFLK